MKWSDVIPSLVSALIAAAIIAISAWIWQSVSDGSLIRVLGGVTEAGLYPSGAVVAFDLADGCPKEGWSEFTDGGGKFVLGESDEFPYREMGGSSLVILEEKHLASHGHGIADGAWGFDVNGNDHMLRIDRDDGSAYKEIAGTLEAEPTGGGEPHENMPPYIVLHLCKKE